MCICVKHSKATMNQLKEYGFGHYIDDSMYEVTLCQSELNSLNLGWLHFKQPGLTKTNPYVCIDIFVLDEFTIAFQQLYTDSIAVKIIGRKELIEEIELTKRYEEKVSWKDELDSIRNYQVEYNMNRLQDYEDKTSIDDYDIKWEVTDSWRNILQAKKEIAPFLNQTDSETKEVIEYAINEISKKIIEVVKKEKLIIEIRERLASFFSVSFSKVKLNILSLYLL